MQKIQIQKLKIHMGTLVAVLACFYLESAGAADKARLFDLAQEASFRKVTGEEIQKDATLFVQGRYVYRFGTLAAQIIPKSHQDYLSRIKKRDSVILDEHLMFHRTSRYRHFLSNPENIEGVVDSSGDLEEYEAEDNANELEQLSQIPSATSLLTQALAIGASACIVKLAMDFGVPPSIVLPLALLNGFYLESRFYDCSTEEENS